MVISSPIIAGKRLGENGDPWAVLGGLVKNPKELPADLKDQVRGFSRNMAISSERTGEEALRACKAAGAIQIYSLKQASRWWDRAARNEAELQFGLTKIEDGLILKNPYIICTECDRLQPEPIAFRTIDQGALSGKAWSRTPIQSRRRRR